MTTLFVIFLFVGTWATFTVVGGERARRVQAVEQRRLAEQRAIEAAERKKQRQQEKAAALQLAAAKKPRVPAIRPDAVAAAAAAKLPASPKKKAA